MKLNRLTSERISEVFDIKILGEAGVKNLMDMLLKNETLVKDGDILLEGLNTLDIIKENCNKILTWDRCLK